MVNGIIFFVFFRGADPEIGTDVNDLQTGFDQRNGIFGGESMRKRKECDIAGSGDFSSAISAMQQPGSGYPKVEKLLAGNELKITKTSFSGALQKLLDEGFLKAG